MDKDMINRQQAIDSVQGIGRLATLPDNDAVIRMSAVEYVLYNLPPAQPERKTGKWIDGKRMKHDGTFYWFRQCDQCGYERNDCDTEKDSNFCPDCGADMRQIGGQDGKR